MLEKHQLSLTSALFININIMLGTGIFINTVELAKRAGLLSAFSYLLVGLLIFPLVLSLAALVKKHPSGGFYIFGAQEIHPLAGFISAWSYFVGKLASAGLMIHVAVLLFQQLLPCLQTINPLLLDSALLIVFTAFNLFNVRTGGHIQVLFMSLKTVPILFVLGTAAFLARASNLNAAQLLWAGIPSTVPLVLYAASGFEAAVSLSSRIKDAARNAPRAIIISYVLVICSIALYQLMFYLMCGATTVSSYLDVFPSLAQRMHIIFPLISTTFGAALNSAIALSALGGSYGILYSNNWNLYTLAQHKHIAFSPLFTWLNKHHIPVACIIAETVICLLYLLFTRGTIVPLQQMSALAGLCAYTLSVIALVKMRFGVQIGRQLVMPLCALGSCGLLGFFCIKSMLLAQTNMLPVFLVLLAIGIGMFLTTQMAETEKK